MQTRARQQSRDSKPPTRSQPRPFSVQPEQHRLESGQGRAPRAGSPTSCRRQFSASRCAPAHQGSAACLLLSRRCCGCSSICACPAGRLQLLDESAGSAPVDDAPARSHPLHAAWPDDALRAHVNARSMPGTSACSCSQARSHFSTAPACATPVQADRQQGAAACLCVLGNKRCQLQARGGTWFPYESRCSILPSRMMVHVSKPARQQPTAGGLHRLSERACCACATCSPSPSLWHSSQRSAQRPCTLQMSELKAGLAG